MRLSLMSFLLFAILLCALSHVTYASSADDEADDFAEFESADDDYDDIAKKSDLVQPKQKAKEAPVPAAAAAPAVKPTPPSPAAAGVANNNNNNDDDDEILIEDDFENFDEDEYAAYERTSAQPKAKGAASNEPPQITAAQIPSHLMRHWDSYWREMLLIAGLVLYGANYFNGRSKNAQLAQQWFATHRSLLEDNFALVGDDGTIENEHPGLLKQSDSLYTLWCSGRTCCEGMLVELKWLKRQDLAHMLARFLKPQLDQVHIKVDLTPGMMDPFVFCVGSRKTVARFFKEYLDLSKYCTLVSKPDRYNVPNGFSVLSELPEATSAMLEPRVLTALNKYHKYIDYLYISDQFSGQIPAALEDSATPKRPETKPTLLIGLNVPADTDFETLKPILLLVFYLMERLKLYRLSKEGKLKSDKNRMRVEEEFLKSTHAARAEAAAQRREDKRRAEKERILAEEDPEKQRRWEIKEQKREAKKKMPKMKRLAVKSL